MANGNTIELASEQVTLVREALVEEMERTCEIIREHLNGHLDGSSVGLADARDWIRTLNRLAECMESLDPPGWRQTLGKLEVVA